MPGTITGLQIAKDLIDGSMDAAELETNLTTNAASYLGAFKALVKSGTLVALLNSSAAFAALHGSDTALQYAISNPLVQDAILASSAGRTSLAGTSEALATILNDSALRDKFLDDSNFKTALETATNNSTYLYRETVTATGNYTPHADGIAAMFIVAVGPGGSGGTANNNRGGSGGSAGAMSGKQIAVASIPSSPVACAVPTTAGTSTSFGALLTVASGVNGSATSSTTTGGGTTSGGGVASGLSNTNLDAAAWHYADFVEQGGDGGGGGIDGGPQSGINGEAGVTGSGGTGATSANPAGGAGSGFCSGGGGGFATNVGTGIRNGTAATAPGCGGGGGNSNDGDGSYGAGGAGGPGKIWVYTVRNRP